MRVYLLKNSRPILNLSVEHSFVFTYVVGAGSVIAYLELIHGRWIQRHFQGPEGHSEW